jgi:hypothetical protein
MTPNLPLLTLSNAQIAVEAMATIAFALSGLIEAARRKLDAVGVCVVAGLAAFGGGTLRDVLLDRRPFFWVEHANWLWAPAGAVRGGDAFPAPAPPRADRTRDAVARRAGPGPVLRRRHADRAGFGRAGAGGGADGRGHGGFGGVLRDIVCNEIPRAFSDHRPYAVCAFVGGWVSAMPWPTPMHMVHSA